MKKNIFTLTLLIAIASQSFIAQLPSVKLPKPASSSSATDKKDKDEPEYDANSPIYKSFSKCKENLKFAEKELETPSWVDNKAYKEKSNETILGFLEVAQKEMNTLKELGEGEKKYFKTLQANYSTIESQRAKGWQEYMSKHYYVATLEKYNTEIVSCKNSTSTPKYPYFSYTTYQTFLKNMKANQPDAMKNEYNIKMLNNIDSYFNTDIPAKVVKLNGKLEFLESEMNKQNTKGEPDYKLNAKNILKKFDEFHMEVVFFKDSLVPDKQEITKIEERVIKNRKFLNEYIESGAYDKAKSEFNQGKIDEARVGKKGMTNAQYETMAAEQIKSSVGKVLKTVITSKDWEVSINDFGKPIRRYVVVEVVVKENDGKCYIYFVEIIQDYQGGGVYSTNEKAKLFDSKKPINCDNINK